MTELDVFLENWDRFRSVTLQFLEVLKDDDLNWRPEAEAFSCGQQLLHIAQTEDYCFRGLFVGEWDKGILRVPRNHPFGRRVAPVLHARSAAPPISGSNP